MEDQSLMNTYLQVSFLPWIQTKRSLCIGPIRFWPYCAEAEQRIKAQEIRDHLTRYFRSFVDHQGRPVGSITVCSYSDADFRCLEDFEYRELRRAVDVMIFATIAPQVKTTVCANNRSMGPPSADIYELVTQNFQPGSDHVAVHAGTVKSGGWRIGEIIFPKPWATGGTLGTPDEELAKGFDKCFSPEFSVDIRERLFRSLEWFRMAHIEGGQVSELSKVVMMATGFEILLQFPRKGKRQHFMDYMKKKVTSDKFIKDTRITDKGDKLNLSLVEWWASDFYELRNRIVHGDQVPESDLIYRDWITHLIVADLVFLECVKRELFEYKCIGNNIRSHAKKFDKMFPNEPEGVSIEPLARWFLGFNNIHRALGWIPRKRASHSSYT